MKKTNITLSIALAAVFSASTAFAEAEVSGKIVHESAKFTTSGTTIGAATAHGKDAFKQETSARIYIDGEVNDDATYHVELNLMKDGKAGANYDGNESYTQRDALREAYVDTQQGDWAIRAGKQQVVWGTADGMKLLDMINPSDYGEMAQNQMEDSRIPVWMINAEKTNADGSEIQVVVSQPKENVFAGLNRNISTSVRTNSTTMGGDGSFADTTKDNATPGQDQGHAFIMQGVDSITGKSNGFVNIVPDMGTVARSFALGFATIDAGYSGTTECTDNTSCGTVMGASSPFSTALGMTNMGGFTVGGFKVMTMDDMAANMGGMGLLDGTNGGTGYENLPVNFRGNVDKVWGYLTAAQKTALGVSAPGELTGAMMLDMGFQPGHDTNISSFGDGVINSAFEYMQSTTFETFNAFVNAKSQYVYNMPDNSDIDLAARYKNTTSNGINYSLNASYNYDKNPIINMSWRNDAGELLEVEKTVNPAGLGATTTLRIKDANGYYGAGVTARDVDGDGVLDLADGDQAAVATQGAATLRFEQTVKRAMNIGGSFDTAIETAELGPVVIRGEALYQKDVYSPVMNLNELSIGNLTESLKMVKGDRVKFVLGADITLLTNMMVSAQFIQDRNLDYVDSADGKNYTTDYATMSLNNSFNKAEKNKEFYSLFFSKPFGASGEHRWNNIFMFEENGGKWNRLDAEFSIDDDTQATVEYNKYWGDANTQFGQLEAASNIQVGVKYSF